MIRAAGVSDRRSFSAIKNFRGAAPEQVARGKKMQ
jgi:hypothetical protein